MIYEIIIWMLQNFYLPIWAGMSQELPTLTQMLPAPFQPVKMGIITSCYCNKSLGIFNFLQSLSMLNPLVETLNVKTSFCFISVGVYDARSQLIDRLWVEQANVGENGGLGGWGGGAHLAWCIVPGFIHKGV